MRRAILLAGSLLVSIHSSPALAQVTYGSLATVKPNHWIRVEKQDDTRIEGRFLGVRSDSLYLRPDTSSLGIAMSGIARIDERTHSTNRGVLIGLVAGAAFGALVGAGSSRPDDLLSPGAAAAAGGIFFGFVGAGVGAIIGSVSHHWARRYQAPEQAVPGTDR